MLSRSRSARTFSLFARKKIEEPQGRQQEHTTIAILKVGSRQEIRAYHLQTIAAGSIRTQHQGRRAAQARWAKAKKKNQQN